MLEWRDMFGKELKVGYWVAIPGRNGELGTQPLAAGWYQIEQLRIDDEGDWIIRLAGGRQQWLISWDTLPASDQPECPRYDHELSSRIHASDVRRGQWLYAPAPVNGWFEVASYPLSRAGTDEVTISLIGNKSVRFKAYAKVSVRAENPNAHR